MCLSLNLNLYYNIDSGRPEGFDSNIALSYAKYIPTLRVISMIISEPSLEDLYLDWNSHVPTWWIVTRAGPSVDLVYVQENEGECMKRMYNEEFLSME